MKMNFVLFLSLLLTAPFLNAQNASDHQAPVLSINPALLKGYWPAAWIGYPGSGQRSYGVYHFRKTIDLSAKPGKFIVHVSADNRYRLFVNGEAVCNGPARGDLYNWFFETVDLAPFLKAGKNTIAALVWNMAELAAVAQVTNQTGFLLQGDGMGEQMINTDKSWKVLRDSAYQPCSIDNGSRLHTYMVIGPGDQVKGNAFPWGWELPGYIDKGWQQAASVAAAVTSGNGTDNIWTLAPRNIPLFPEYQQRISTVRRSKGVTAKDDFLRGGHPLTIPARATVTILLDQGVNTVAYPELMTSGGKGAKIKLTYAEALFNAAGEKGNRNEINGMEIKGNFDLFEPDGGNKRLFRPLWFRGFRYLQLDITTGSQPLTLDDVYGMHTGYPFQVSASFTSNDPSLKQIWDVGWRTAQLCAGENYFDCPYYEQLQYEGDTRIQSLISLYMTGDDRLMRKALLDFYHSRVPEGLTQGRYPSNRLQVIPPFSLFWVSMVYDYWMHKEDRAFIVQFLPSIQGVLSWYEKNIDKGKNMLGPLKWWNFVDWSTKFKAMGEAEGTEDGNSSIATLQFAYTLQQAADLFDNFHKPYEAGYYRTLAGTLNEGTYQRCFDTGKGEMGDTPDKIAFSQHASILGILSSAVPDNQSRAVMQKILDDTSMNQVTFFYRFYLVRALKKAGMADLYYSQLTPWRDMLKIGLTTFAEKPEPTRSDCHAWSSSPNYDFLATICGIMPDAPGFSKVLIQPALGELTEVKGVMPHPAGTISVTLKRKPNSSGLTSGNSGIEGEVVLPEGVSGRFVWQGKEITLTGGAQKIDL
ncbi:alpha-L-rhamnosidase-related protein [Flavitalea flava]